MIVMTLVGPAIKDGCEGHSSGGIFLGKPKQHLRSRQVHNNEEMEMAVRESFCSGNMLENNVTSVV
jgi:hypothetical protein